MKKVCIISSIVILVTAIAAAVACLLLHKTVWASDDEIDDFDDFDDFDEDVI